MARPSTDHRDERGQVLIIVAVGLVAMLAMVGLIVDGGVAWGQQRDTQNAADASAEAGAIKMVERLVGIANSDDDVWAAVKASGEANGFPPDGASTIDPTTDCLDGAAPANDQVGVCGYYTDVEGNLVLDGNGEAIAVGSLSGADPPAGAAGVQAVGRKVSETFLMQVIGFNEIGINAGATAVAGYVSAACPASAGCGVLPVTFPVAIVQCDGQGDAVLTDTNYSKNTADPYVIPLCKNSPGNVGWLDWTPPAGGTSELITAIGPPGTNPTIPVPSWQYVTSTGNINSLGVEDALRWYDGKVVLIPQFDVTCSTQPTGPEDSPNHGCPEANVGGLGQNQWYHLPQFAAFQFCGTPDGGVTPNWCAGPYAEAPSGYDHGAYINGNNSDVCESQGGNGSTSCLVGRFVDFLTNTTITGNVGAASNTGLLGVQLIR